jgi:hypothetical protein
MKPSLLLLLLLVSLSCHQDVALNEQLYGKWLLTGGSALAKRQASVKASPIYFVFTTHGSIESNWSNCYSFRFGDANELLISNGCVDCAVEGCEQSVWHYRFTGGNELTIEFQPGDVGFLQR